MKTLAIVTGTLQTLDAVQEQVRAILPDSIKIEGYAVDEEDVADGSIQVDYVVYSTPDLEDIVAQKLAHDTVSLCATRTMNHSQLDKLWRLESGMHVWFVNDRRETCDEAIASLLHLGLHHIHYHPYYPGILPEDMPTAASSICTAVTPGEIQFVPGGMKTVIDLGPRLFGMTTVVEILQAFHIPIHEAHHTSELYMQKIVSLGRELAVTTTKVEHLNQQLQHVLNAMEEGILLIDPSQKIAYANENMEPVLLVPPQQAKGRRIRQVIGSEVLCDFIERNHDEQAVIEWRGEDVYATKLHVEGGCVITLHRVSQLTDAALKSRRELGKKGHLAKYQFDDIVGQSPEIRNAIQTAKKLAATDFTVLIEGESGTGKELFASAMHHESVRRHKPFVAVNVGALPEELVESELFGYEEGAFTGAKRGGKPGLFELATGGTLFLDEIGDISPKIQTRLLRVLQEQEIMRVGGSKIIPIDVRLIAATNRPLREMVQAGHFREDLFHRLGVLYMKLPPLRSRTNDVPCLLHFFLRQSKGTVPDISKTAMQHLQAWHWPGNIRELQNAVHYMTTVCQGARIEVSDLPDTIVIHGDAATMADFADTNSQFILSAKESQDIFESHIHVPMLRILSELRRNGASSGRAKIAERLAEEHIMLSAQQVRGHLKRLEQLGLVVISKGRSGARLTEHGEKTLTLKHLAR